ncbi:hypothetical protein E1211_08920 [Micromonospora sp. 15K316]|uniref:RICIN domain-containing protein n=1 Tax=Micromonospora sp. 15K316 TaxID=2530376 RepID=UPI001045C7B1|nr:RICIN domain-containing protein [Micromonospora sp. 15K316]TDC37881.1 hypothetical protein E1211_08920 [Micromonospora sp. 15K316]
MADPRDDLTAIADGARRTTKLPPAQTLRDRSDRRRRRRTAVTGVGLAALALVIGAVVVQAREQAVAPDRGVVAPAGQVPPSAVPSVTASAGPREILTGRRQVAIVVPGMNRAMLAIDRDGDQVRATTERGVDDRARWVLRPDGDRFRIVLAGPGGGGQTCMTVVHDAAPGSVRVRTCEPGAQTQLFTIEQEADGSFSLFQGRRYVQVVDGTNALVPDLPEALTTTYEFEDRGPVVDE